MLTKRASAMLILASLAFVAYDAPAGEGNSPSVIPPQASHHGLTYGEWSERWWQWPFSLPVDAHPLFDTADCSEGQSGPVWFLGGTFAAIEIEPGVILGEVERNCTIPVGKSLFFPLVNAECSTLEGNGETEEELRECAEFFANFIVPESLFCEVDGQSVKNLPDFRVQSPLFVYGPLPDNNILQFFGLDAPAGSVSPCVADGVFVMLAPLPVGQHTIRFGGVSDFRSIGGPLFIQDVTYHITVAPQ